MTRRNVMTAEERRAMADALKHMMRGGAAPRQLRLTVGASYRTLGPLRRSEVRK